MDEDIRDDMEQVAEDATPETDVEAVEQRTDDYDAIARRLDDIIEALAGIAAGIERVEAMSGAFVEAGATIRESDFIEDDAEEPGDDEPEFVTIDELDLN